MSHSQWLSPDKIIEQQFHGLKRILRHAQETVPFYSRSFLKAGIVPDEITPENWSKVPILTRKSLQTEEILSNKIPPSHGKISKTQTSGSTGQPVTVCGTGLTNFFWKAFSVRDHLWRRRDLSGKLATIRYNPLIQIPEEVREANSWGAATSGLFKTGPSALQSVRTTIEHQLKWLINYNPHFILTYPSNLGALLERCLEQGKSFPRLKEVMTISETLSPELRVRCKEVWDVPITDIYSSQEFGYMALQCPDYEHYHIQSEGVLLEILDDEGTPCRAGEVGRIVVTSLHNYATPLIRYEIRDYAEAGAPCPCGRGLPVIRRIVGRHRNMLTLPSGEKTWPITGFPRYKEVAPIRQFQFIQHSLEKVEMRLVVDNPLNDEQKIRLQKIITEGLGYPFSIVFTQMPEIPQAANGKFEEFISLVSQPSD